MKQLKRLILTLFVVLLFATPFQAATTATTKTITKAAKQVELKAGNKYRLKIKGVSSVKWTAKNNKTLSITQKGVLTAKKAGQTKVTYKIGTKKKTITIIVKKAAVKTEYVYLSATGSKYHKVNDCGTMNPDKATRVKLSDAINQGYTPCKNCFK